MTKKSATGGMSADSQAATPPESFEERIERLEEIVGLLEKGEAPLETSLALFEEGVNLSRVCQEQLDAARQRVEVLLEAAEEGAEVTRPLSEEEGGQG